MNIEAKKDIERKDTFEVFKNEKNTGLTIRKNGDNWILYNPCEVPIMLEPTVQTIIDNIEL